MCHSDGLNTLLFHAALLNMRTIPTHAARSSGKSLAADVSRGEVGGQPIAAKRDPDVLPVEAGAHPHHEHLRWASLVEMAVVMGRRRLSALGRQACWGWEM